MENFVSPVDEVYTVSSGFKETAATEPRRVQYERGCRHNTDEQN